MLLLAHALALRELGLDVTGNCRVYVQRGELCRELLDLRGALRQLLAERADVGGGGSG